MKTNFLSDFVELFYPRVCAVCSDALFSGEQVLCLNCMLEIPRTNHHLHPNNELEKRCWGRFKFNRMTAFYHFKKGSNYQHLLHDLKYHDQPEIGQVLGRIAGFELLETMDFKKVELIVPVPLHPRKLRKRGYNQSEEIAKGLASALQVPIDTNHLYRINENQTQTKKGFFERFENTVGIFELLEPQDLEGKTILLVDDVITTGSTLEACVHAMEKVEDLTVNIFALAQA